MISEAEALEALAQVERLGTIRAAAEALAISWGVAKRRYRRGLELRDATASSRRLRPRCCG